MQRPRARARSDTRTQIVRSDLVIRDFWWGARKSMVADKPDEPHKVKDDLTCR
jgi:hypothetical protein